MKFEEILAAARMWGPGKSGICTPETLTRFEKFEGIGFYTDRIGGVSRVALSGRTKCCFTKLKGNIQVNSASDLK